MVITKALALVNGTLLEDGTPNSMYLPRENGAKSLPPLAGRRNNSK
jgi:hypothetical protein